MLKYKGYSGVVEYDDEADIFHGTVIGLKDVITFQGTSTTELRQAFQDSIDDYLEFCEKQGRKAEKPFSGTFLVRTTPEIHRSVMEAAAEEHTSLNQWVENALWKAVERFPNTSAY